MALALVIVACILFLLTALSPLFQPSPPWFGSLGWLGLFFWALSTIVGKV